MIANSVDSDQTALYSAPFGRFKLFGCYLKINCCLSKRMKQAISTDNIFKSFLRGGGRVITLPLLAVTFIICI